MSLLHYLVLKAIVLVTTYSPRLPYLGLFFTFSPTIQLSHLVFFLTTADLNFSSLRRVFILHEKLFVFVCSILLHMHPWSQIYFTFFETHIVSFYLRSCSIAHHSLSFRPSILSFLLNLSRWYFNSSSPTVSNLWTRYQKLH